MKARRHIGSDWVQSVSINSAAKGALHGRIYRGARGKVALIIVLSRARRVIGNIVAVHPQKSGNNKVIEHEAL